MVEEPLAPTQRHHLDQVLGRARVLLAARVARVDEGVEPDVGDESGPPAGDLAAQQRQNSLREGIRLDLVGLDEGAERGFISDVRADRPPHQARQSELGETPLAKVADAYDANRREVPRMALLAVDVGQRVDEQLGHGVAGPGPANDQGGAIGDAAHGIA